MAEIKIGHASQSENETADGVPGEQKSFEVCINTLAKKYYAVLRPKTASLAKNSARACEAACENSNIGYGQSDRNSLYAEAVKVNFDLSKITTPCNADCASFMSVCAIAGGSTMAYGYNNSTNAPAVPTISEWFEKSGDYEVKLDSKFIDTTDYLKRGDILLIENHDYDTDADHVAMVLTNGAKVPNDYFIEIKTKSITKTAAKFSAKIFELAFGDDLIEKNDKWIKSCTITYELEQLGTNSETNKEPVTVQDLNNIVISDLTPNNTYRLKIVLLKESEKFYSASVLFSTLQDYPLAVKALKFIPGDTFCKDLLNKNSLTENFGSLSFAEPSTWGEYASKRPAKGYYVSLLLNGKIVASKETTTFSNTILLDLLNQVESFKLNDILQIGIQTWVQDEYNRYIFNNQFFRCTEPLCLNTEHSVINRMYVHTEDAYNQAMLYDIKCFNEEVL